MNCRYCGSANAADEHRCHHCGRRLPGAVRAAPDPYPVQRDYPTAGARALAPQPRMAAFEEVVPEVEPARRAPYQPALFTTRELGRVVPIEAYRPTSPAERRARAQESAAPPRPQRPEAAGVQQPLAFAASAAASTGATVKARPIHTDPKPAANAPVAIPMHRLMAGAIDSAMVLLALAMFATVVQMIVGLDALGSWALPGLAVVGALFGVGYKLLWAFAEFDSPGQVWCQLRLLNFDGQAPNRQERIERIGWACVSVLPACLGLIWALVDEETLSWTDHSSQTFLTSFSSPTHAR